ncbi:MAG TPA: 30S ribosomal protein S3 [Candidatus Gracilibacteria bacterium]|nr:30S ribosomal protein S3 [Candidatus Gracilibacteria bacterium]
MGQKVNPNILRIGIIRSWDSKWYADKRNFSKMLHQDLEIQKIIQKKLADASVSKIEIHRTANRVIVHIHSAKPGLIIGRQGAGIEALKEELEKKFHEEFSLSIKEINKPTLDAKLLADNIAKQIEKRISYRRASKISVDKAMESGALGAKVFCAGRLNGVEIARSEFFSRGKIPLHTLRADIDYAMVHAKTAFGTIGVKVWIYKGDIFKKKGDVRVTEVKD